jgi:cobalamin biosynthesis protein CbiD
MKAQCSFETLVTIYHSTQKFVSSALNNFRAVLVENEDGTRIKVSATDWTQRESVAKRLLTPGDTSDVTKGRKIVCTVNFN